ncbi:MAG: carbohydrate kinase family protein [Clostridia bacterium]|nr:carbohydrate kinase family protein [Clostridia bacterium]
MALLFIGSTVADVVIRLPQLPYTGDDVHITSQQVSLGGCAYNAYHTARLTGLTDCTLFSPVGTGVWGDWVRRALADRRVQTAVPPVDAPNGCCYCLVEPNGERTFMCEHGAEYAFRPEWFDALTGDYGGVYVCGLEIEEPTGEVILDWLEQHPPRRLYFAPGPRLMHIPPRKMARLMELHAVFHMNEAEICHFTRSQDVSQAAHMLQTLTQSDVIVTLGERGAYVLHDDEEAIIPGVPARVVDTIGAGDAHIGAVMAFEAADVPLVEAVRRANAVSAAVVSQNGAELSKEKYEAIEARRFY